MTPLQALFALAGVVGVIALYDDARKEKAKTNPEFFTDSNGVTHPIRHGEGLHTSSGGRYSERVRQQRDAKGTPATKKAGGDVEVRMAKSLREIKNASPAAQSKLWQYFTFSEREQDKILDRTGLSGLTDGQKRAFKESVREIIPADVRHVNKKFSEELAELRSQQRALYQFPPGLTGGDIQKRKAKAAPQYAELKRREEQILAKARAYGFGPTEFR